MKTKQNWLLIFLLSFVGCKHAPLLTVCLINAEQNTLECSDANNQAFTLPIESADNYVCMSPEDFKTLLDYAKSKCQN